MTPDFNDPEWTLNEDALFLHRSSSLSLRTESSWSDVISEHHPDQQSRGTEWNASELIHLPTHTHTYTHTHTLTLKHPPSPADRDTQKHTDADTVTCVCGNKPAVVQSLKKERTGVRTRHELISVSVGLHPVRGDLKSSGPNGVAQPSLKEERLFFVCLFSFLVGLFVCFWRAAQCNVCVCVSTVPNNANTHTFKELLPTLFYTPPRPIHPSPQGCVCVCVRERERGSKRARACFIFYTWRSFVNLVCLYISVLKRIIYQQI